MLPLCAVLTLTPMEPGCQASQGSTWMTSEARPPSHISCCATSSSCSRGTGNGPAPQGFDSGVNTCVDALTKRRESFSTAAFARSIVLERLAARCGRCFDLRQWPAKWPPRWLRHQRRPAAAHSQAATPVAASLHPPPPPVVQCMFEMGTGAITCLGRPIHILRDAAGAIAPPQVCIREYDFRKRIVGTDLIVEGVSAVAKGAADPPLKSPAQCHRLPYPAASGGEV